MDVSVMAPLGQEDLDGRSNDVFPDVGSCSLVLFTSKLVVVGNGGICYFCHLASFLL